MVEPIRLLFSEALADPQAERLQRFLVQANKMQIDIECRHARLFGRLAAHHAQRGGRDANLLQNFTFEAKFGGWSCPMENRKVLAGSIHHRGLRRPWFFFVRKSGGFKPDGENFISACLTNSVRQGMGVRAQLIAEEI